MTTRNSYDSETNSMGRNLINLCQTAQMRIVNGRVLGDLEGRYTCYKYNGQSVVDYFIVNEKFINNIILFKVGNISYLSDHCSISIIINLKKGLNNNSYNKYKLEKLTDKFVWSDSSSDLFKTILSSETNKFELDLLLNQLNMENDSIDIDNHINKLTHILASAGESSLKVIKTSTCKQKHKPWFDKTCSDHKKQVNKLGGIMKANPKNLNVRHAYYKAKKTLKKTIKQKKNEQENKVMKTISDLKDRKGNSKDFWKLFKSLNKKKSTSENIGKLITPECWFDYYKNLNSEDDQSSDKTFENSIIHKLENLRKRNNKVQNKTLDSPISEKDIKGAIKSLKNNKASGIDKISSEMIKSAINYIEDHLIKIFNILLQSGKYPSTWSKGYIVPIYKSGREEDPSNYRGITITSCLGKLFSIILNNRLTTFLDNENVMNKYQIGFKKDCRTSDHAFVLKSIINSHNKIRKNGKVINKSQPLYMCFVDLAKAFDTFGGMGYFTKWDVRQIH